MLSRLRPNSFSDRWERINMDPSRRTSLNFRCEVNIIEINCWVNISFQNVLNVAGIYPFNNSPEGCVSLLIFGQFWRQYTWVDFLKNRWLDAGNYWSHSSTLSWNTLTSLTCLFDYIISTAVAALSHRCRCIVCSKWWIVGTSGKVAASTIIPQQSILCWSRWLYRNINCLWHIELAWDVSSLIVWALIMLILPPLYEGRIIEP